MFHRITRGLAPAPIFALTVALALQCTALSAWAGSPSESLRVDGAVQTALNLSVSDLKAFPPDQIGRLSVSKRIDGKEANTTVRGVRLSAVLERAGVVAPGRNDWKSLVVLASATDGYKVRFSWPELINTEGGAGVLVIFERDGQALGDDEGHIALIAARDVKSGPRHVKWLNHVEIKQF